MVPNEDARPLASAVGIEIGRKVVIVMVRTRKESFFCYLHEKAVVLLGCVTPISLGDCFV